jgi:peptidoglycan/xylan/chitin deacetylase (PgdA/CDA1 family)
MSLRSTLGVARRQILRSRHRRSIDCNGSGPFVSFTFDDFPRTAYTAGGTILSSLGIRGTYYVAMGLMGTSNALGEQFRLEDLHRVLQDGHELGSHTFSHSSSRKISLSAFRDDVRKGYQALREIVSSQTVGNFAFPYGEATLAAKRAVGVEMMSCRGNFHGVNASDVDLNLLNANPLYGGVDHLDGVERLIRENARQRGWLIFYTHDVQQTPSPYGCTPEFLQAVGKLAGQHAKALPVGEVIRSLQGRASKAATP